MAVAACTSRLAPSLRPLLPDAPSSRIDAPSLALAIARCDEDAVAKVLEAGAPLHFEEPVWGCTSAMEIAQHSYNEVEFEARGMPSTAGRSLACLEPYARIIDVLKDEAMQRSRVEVLLRVEHGRVSATVAIRQRDCTWQEPMPEELPPGATGDVVHGMVRHANLSTTHADNPAIPTTALVPVLTP